MIQTELSQVLLYIKPQDTVDTNFLSSKTITMLTDN